MPIVQIFLLHHKHFLLILQGFFILLATYAADKTVPYPLYIKYRLIYK